MDEDRLLLHMQEEEMFDAQSHQQDNPRVEELEIEEVSNANEEFKRIERECNYSLAHPYTYLSIGEGRKVPGKVVGACVLDSLDDSTFDVSDLSVAELRSVLKDMLLRVPENPVVLFRCLLTRDGEEEVKFGPFTYRLEDALADAIKICTSAKPQRKRKVSKSDDRSICIEVSTLVGWHSEQTVKPTIPIMSASDFERECDQEKRHVLVFVREYGGRIDYNLFSHDDSDPVVTPPLLPIGRCHVLHRLVEASAAVFPVVLNPMGGAVNGYAGSVKPSERNKERSLVVPVPSITTDNATDGKTVTFGVSPSGEKWMNHVQATVSLIAKTELGQRKQSAMWWATPVAQQNVYNACRMLTMLCFTSPVASVRSKVILSCSTEENPHEDGMNTITDFTEMVLVVVPGRSHEEVNTKKFPDGKHLPRVIDAVGVHPEELLGQTLVKILINDGLVDPIVHIDLFRGSEPANEPSPIIQETCQYITKAFPDAFALPAPASFSGESVGTLHCMCVTHQTIARAIQMVTRRTNFDESFEKSDSALPFVSAIIGDAKKVTTTLTASLIMASMKNTKINLACTSEFGPTTNAACILIASNLRLQGRLVYEMFVHSFVVSGDTIVDRIKGCTPTRALMMRVKEDRFNHEAFVSSRSMRSFAQTIATEKEYRFSTSLAVLHPEIKRSIDPRLATQHYARVYPEMLCASLVHVSETVDRSTSTNKFFALWAAKQIVKEVADLTSSASTPQSTKEYTNAIMHWAVVTFPNVFATVLVTEPSVFSPLFKGIVEETASTTLDDPQPGTASTPLHDSAISVPLMEISIARVIANGWVVTEEFSNCAKNITEIITKYRGCLSEEALSDAFFHPQTSIVGMEKVKHIPDHIDLCASKNIATMAAGYAIQFKSVTKQEKEKRTQYLDSLIRNPLVDTENVAIIESTFLRYADQVKGMPIATHVYNECVRRLQGDATEARRLQPIKVGQMDTIGACIEIARSNLGKSTQNLKEAIHNHTKTCHCEGIEKAIELGVVTDSILASIASVDVVVDAIPRVDRTTGARGLVGYLASRCSEHQKTGAKTRVTPKKVATLLVETMSTCSNTLYGSTVSCSEEIIGYALTGNIEHINGPYRSNGERVSGSVPDHSLSIPSVHVRVIEEQNSTKFTVTVDGFIKYISDGTVESDTLDKARKRKGATVIANRLPEHVKNALKTHRRVGAPFSIEILSVADQVANHRAAYECETEAIKVQREQTHQAADAEIQQPAAVVFEYYDEMYTRGDERQKKKRRFLLNESAGIPLRSSTVEDPAESIARLLEEQEGVAPEGLSSTTKSSESKDQSIRAALRHLGYDKVHHGIRIAENELFPVLAKKSDPTIPQVTSHLRSIVETTTCSTDATFVANVVKVGKYREPFIFDGDPVGSLKNTVYWNVYSGTELFKNRFSDTKLYFKDLAHCYSAFAMNVERGCGPRVDADKRRPPRTLVDVWRAYVGSELAMRDISTSENVAIRGKIAVLLRDIQVLHDAVGLFIGSIPSFTDEQTKRSISESIIKHETPTLRKDANTGFVVMLNMASVRAHMEKWQQRLASYVVAGNKYADEQGLPNSNNRECPVVVNVAWGTVIFPSSDAPFTAVIKKSLSRSGYNIDSLLEGKIGARLNNIRNNGELSRYLLGNPKERFSTKKASASFKNAAKTDTENLSAYTEVLDNKTQHGVIRKNRKPTKRDPPQKKRKESEQPPTQQTRAILDALSFSAATENIPDLGRRSVFLPTAEPAAPVATNEPIPLSSTSIPSSVQRPIAQTDIPHAPAPLPAPSPFPAPDTVVIQPLQSPMTSQQMIQEILRRKALAKQRKAANTSENAPSLLEARYDVDSVVGTKYITKEIDHREYEAVDDWLHRASVIARTTVLPTSFYSTFFSTLSRILEIDSIKIDGSYTDREKFLIILAKNDPRSPIRKETTMEVIDYALGTELVNSVVARTESSVSPLESKGGVIGKSLPAVLPVQETVKYSSEGKQAQTSMTEATLVTAKHGATTRMCHHCAKVVAEYGCSICMKPYCNDCFDTHIDP